MNKESLFSDEVVVFYEDNLYNNDDVTITRDDAKQALSQLEDAIKRGFDSEEYIGPCVDWYMKTIGENGITAEADDKLWPTVKSMYVFLKFMLSVEGDGDEILYSLNTPMRYLTDEARQSLINILLAID